MELIHTNQSYTDGTYTIKCSKNLFPDEFIKKIIENVQYMKSMSQADDSGGLIS